MFINILGGDGCGKTTQIRRLERWLSTQNIPVRSIGKRDVYQHDLYSGSPIFNIEYPVLAHQRLPYMPEESRALFLYYMYMLLIRANPPMENEVLLVDGYWHKHYATEVALGINKDWLLNMGQAFPRPDLTIFLELDPELINERGHEHKPYESGCNFSCSDEAFAQHQHRVVSHLRDLALANGYNIVDAGRLEENIFFDIQQIISNTEQFKHLLQTVA